MMVLFLWLMVFVVGFAVGALTILGAEAVGVYVFINRLNEKNLKKQAQISQHSSRDLDPLQSLDFASNKQGTVWVLESEKVSKNLLDKGLKEQKRKKDFLEVSPVKKHAKLKDRKLILVESDGSQIAIDLKGCIVEAVSATKLASGKWAKRFPIKLESKSSVIYNGSKTLYFYLETSWEKESWCKALRLASCDKNERLDLFSKLQKEFHNYLKNINAGYPSFMKPSIGFSSETVDRTNRSDGASSKVRLFLKKIAKKTARVGQENKSTLSSLSGRVERREIEKIRPFQETVSATGLVNTAPSVKRSKSEENMVESSSLSTISNSGSQSHISVISDVDSDDKFCNDEGTLCWNLLISRFFFDLKSNTEMKRSIQSRVQRTLSNMRTPSYIGDVICTDIDLGNLPPYIHGMRILPMDMNEVWMLEVDIEYSGGALLDIETRVEVHELDLQKDIVDSGTGSGSVGDVSSDLLEGFEYYGKQLNLSEGTVDEQREEDGLKSGKSTVSASTHGSRWKSILNAIARQVSQVPLSLAIRLTSLRGTLRLHIKPPPSDQLWFAFTCMPDIDFNLESSVGEHKITNGHIALFLVNRLKASIKESLVLPNSESVCIPWMISEKDDWVPRKVAPFLWLNQEANNGPTTMRESTTSHPSEGKTKTEASKGISSDPEKPCKN
ncbi:hypothetical protein CMV_001193 [Castanea mollissima]|uniref:SMP-LTD domain-containing protein n=1 Tax=Castanea mollissima TaxID=60419 RepID=A0A8J4VX42_9ROSI|nr:hypothetical protein CMV_001193 [Castanea mollissima]